MSPGDSRDAAMPEPTTATTSRAVPTSSAASRRPRGGGVHARATDSPHVSLFGQIRRRKLRLKTILQIMGGNPDELSIRFLNQADLIISTDLPEADLLRGLNSVLDAAS